MIDPLTKIEKIRIEAFHSSTMKPTEIAADIIVGRNLSDFVQMVDIVEAYLKEEKENEVL